MAEYKVIAIRKNPQGKITSIITPSAKKGKALEWSIDEVVTEILNGSHFYCHGKNEDTKIAIQPYICTEDDGSISTFLHQKETT